MVRNASYSADGGLDGRHHRRGILADSGQTVQPCCFPAHVEDFDRLLLQTGRRGLFVHTGRTGKMSRAIRTTSPRLRIISGQRLLTILAGQDVRQYL